MSPTLFKPQARKLPSWTVVLHVSLCTCRQTHREWPLSTGHLVEFALRGNVTRNVQVPSQITKIPLVERWCGERSSPRSMGFSHSTSQVYFGWEVWSSSLGISTSKSSMQ